MYEREHEGEEGEGWRKGGGREREARERDEGRYALLYDANSLPPPPPLSSLLLSYSLDGLTAKSADTINKQTSNTHTAWVGLEPRSFFSLSFCLSHSFIIPYLSEFRSTTQ